MNYAPINNKTSRFTSSRIRQGISTPIRLVLILVLGLTVIYTFFPRALPSFFLGMIAPVWKTNMDAQLGSVTLDELRDTYLSLKEHTERSDALLQENEELKLALGREQIPHPVLATVLKKPPFSAYDSFILDVGSIDGVQVGQKVYTLGVVVIGEIVEVYTNVSRVKLYSSVGETFDVLIGPSHIEATAYGKGGGYFEVTLPRDTKIKIGDIIRIPKLSNSFVGTVGGVASDPSEPFARILFHQLVNIYEQRWVIIDKHVPHE